MGQFTINHIDKAMTIHQDVSDGQMSIMYDKPNWLIDMLSARIMNLELESTVHLALTGSDVHIIGLYFTKQWCQLTIKKSRDV